MEKAKQAEERYSAMVPLKDYARPEDVAEVIAWLIEGARQVTGDVVFVDGGLHIQPPR
jgi:3-oxoacyl-[acyl-carrier protein] reductase